MMNKRKMKIEEDILSISSDDDEDNLPLKVKKNDGSDDEDDRPLKVESCNSRENESLCNLYEESWEKCEFCDLMFHNRYNILVHTAKHIIIPLIKQELYECPECLFQFRSAQDLRVHAFRNHSETTRIPAINQSLVKCEPGTIVCATQNNHKAEDAQLKVNNLLESFVKREPLVKCDDLNISSFNTNIKTTSFKSRLMFEDEINEDDILTDLTTDCKVNIEMFEGPWFDHREKRNLNVELPLKTEYISVCYDELMLPGKYGCRSCGMSLPNRYELVIHETNHIKMKARIRTQPLCPVCERYIPGNYRSLRQHIETKHTTTPVRKHTTHTCKQCGLKYINFDRHVLNYHLIYKCRRCGKGFDVEQDRSKHVEECNNFEWDLKYDPKWDSRILKLCDLCNSFTRNKQNCQYVDMGDYSEIGKRQSCDHCGNAFFELKMIKAWHLQRIQKGEKRKGPSCQDRLMKRLKMLKKKYICGFISN